jgi:hypothetical protein
MKWTCLWASALRRPSWTAASKGPRTPGLHRFGAGRLPGALFAAEPKVQPLGQRQPTDGFASVPARPCARRSDKADVSSGRL